MPRSVGYVDVRGHVDLRFSGQTSQRLVDQDAVRNFQPGPAAAATFGRKQRPFLLERSERDRQRRLAVDVGSVATPPVEDVRHFGESNRLPELFRRLEVNLLVLGQGDRVERLGAVRGYDLVGAAGALVVGPERDAASG